MEHIFTKPQVHEHSVIRVFTWVVFLLLSGILPGQQQTDKKVLKLVDKAREATKKREFFEARDYLRKALDKDDEYAGTYEQLFIINKILGKEQEVHRLQRRYIEQVPEPYIDSRVWQSLASYEFKKGHYQMAKQYLSKVAAPDSVLKASVDFSLNEISDSVTLQLEELPSQVNSLAYQYFPVLSIDNRTLIFTGRKEKGSDEDIYESTYDGEKWSTSRPISDQINTPYNEGACSISADGRTLIFTSCEGRQTVGNCDLYLSEKRGNEWSAIKNLGKTVNSRFWDSQPALSADGKTVFFVSNRPGGIGGRDIWMTRQVDGQWTSPENLGSPVNTKKDETTPYIHADGKTLFFSSNGHVGLGGFDLYKAVLDSGKWKEVQNLGYPINTYNDEVSLFITADGKQAYFAKERTFEGQIQESRLVSYSLAEEENWVTGIHYLTGVIRDAKTNDPLGAEIQMVNLANRDRTYTTESDPVLGRYYLALPAGQAYTVFIERKGYLFNQYALEVDRATNDTLDFLLEPVRVGASMVLRNIYFEFDSDELNSKSFEELDRVLKILTENPEIRVEISGHTDNVGDLAYNLDLSTRRAKRVYDFLISKGILEGRIVYRGYGAQRPLNQNQTEIEKSKNRRIEFKVLSGG